MSTPDAATGPPDVSAAANHDAHGRHGSDASWPDDVLTDLVGTHERALLAYAQRMLGGDWQGAQDAVQETFLRLCREDRRKIEHRVVPWLYSVCRTRVIDMQRTKRARPMDTSEVMVADPRPDASTAAADDEEQSQLALEVERLTPRQQEVIRLRLQAGLSYREIAEVTGLTVSNVGFHLHAAVRSLKDSLAVSP
ncbi:RNA polymerase sigma factor [Stieleria varia]|uniref:ECF RNA polymerase sigma factor SigE n=1 Tax=Stieleria varia TaxID=2528005 RepID=A0A5C6B7T8_9BACT|nr:sigma-70 family RNA polymerase sigma factor [Stieleria varia]TWU08325.1 ECF RNA polymerase sigma factor SigE [Stieleria varia]